MAIGWITVLQMVPWGEVIANAPKVADAAKKLWGSVSGKPGETKSVGADGTVPLEKQVAQLHEQMRASSEVIKALAEQNTQLIKRVETMRRRTLGLAVVTMVTLVLAITGLALALGR